MKKTNTPPLLQVKNLSLKFPGKYNEIEVLKQVSFSISEGKTLGIVGESGCGKSMTSLAIMGLLPDNAIVKADELLFQGENLLQKTEQQLLQLRGASLSMIFQDPMTALNPCFTVGDQLLETLRAHGVKKSKQEYLQRARDLMGQVGISDPDSRLHAYPHQLSGGMAQRVMIAQALALGPKLLVADEPTTALDVTIQAQILRLLKSLQKKMHMGLILITHDIGVVSEMADDILVMYAGEVVESGPLKDVLTNPQHPYTRGLLDSLPATHTRAKETLNSIAGLVPNLAMRPTGCQFNPRCLQAQDRCRTGQVEMQTTKSRQVRCHFPLRSLELVE